MKKLRRLLISILYIMAVVNCKLEVPTSEPVILTVEETTEESTIEETIEIEEIDIMNDFIVKPFTEYPAYFTQGNAVTGIPADAKGPTDLMRFLPEIEIDGQVSIYHFDEFFVKDGKVYFIISVNFATPDLETDPETIIKYCTIKDGEIVYLTEAKFPAMPESERIEGQAGDYEISISDYNGDPISVASRYRNVDGETVHDYDEPFVMIDGFIEIEGGLLIHTPTGRGSSRPAGLLFWPEGLRTMNPWKEVGRFWK